MVDEVARYSDADLAEFKEIILKKIQKAQADLDLIKSAYMNDLNNGTDDTSPTFKAFEEGSETMSKEANSQTNQQRKAEDRSSRHDEYRSKKPAAIIARRYYLK
jgi:uncharacterized protein